MKNQHDQFLLQNEFETLIPGAGTLGGFIFGLVGVIGGAIVGGWGSDRIDDAGRR